MIFIVEDGTGKKNATSFTGVAFADRYFDTLGYEEWETLTEDEKKKALNQGTRYINLFRFVGIKRTQEQALSWPRQDAVDTDGYVREGIPVEIKIAACEAAVRAHRGEFFKDRDNSIKSSKVDDVSIEYFEGVSKEKTFPIIERLLAGIVFQPEAGGLNFTRGTLQVIRT